MKTFVERSRRLGRIIAKRREQLGLTQSSVAARAGTGQTKISAWELGVNYPSWDSLQGLLAALGLTLTELDSLLDSEE